MDDQAICGAGNDSGLLYHHHHHHNQLIGDPVADPFPQTIRGNPANMATTSDDEEDGQTLTNTSKKSSPWQRMKWTDEVVRLLINVVAFVDANEVHPPASASAAAGGGGKKGKWKTVSKLMMERSCFVSPQQCEDKFNDLNKRYKRLNEILGRGTTCDVVEDPSLLDSMHHVPVKAKEDVRRILGSKHLFYREMCAYHNGQKIPNSQNLERLEFSDDDDVGESEEEEDEEELKEVEGGGGDNEVVEGSGREWLRKRDLELMEEGVGLRMAMFELEKRRLKWRRFVGKKDREMERLRLENERLRLENERMVLRVRKRELELNQIKCTEEGL